MRSKRSVTRGVQVDPMMSHNELRVLVGGPAEHERKMALLEPDGGAAVRAGRLTILDLGLSSAAGRPSYSPLSVDLHREPSIK